MEYGGEAYTHSTWFGGTEFVMEGDGTDTYCVTAGCRGDDVLIPTRVGDEASMPSIWLSGAVCAVFR